MKIKCKKDYRRQREQDYPAISEQLDMLWHSMELGVLPISEPFFSKIKEIKDKYPKDSAG